MGRIFILLFLAHENLTPMDYKSLRLTERKLTKNWWKQENKRRKVIRRTEQTTKSIINQLIIES